MVEFARKVLGSPRGKEIDFVPWVERAKSTCIILPTTVDSVLKIGPREEVRSLFLARPDQKIPVAIAFELALSVVHAAEKEVEAGGGVSAKDDLKWRGAPGPANSGSHCEKDRW